MSCGSYFTSHQSNQVLPIFKENPFEWFTQQRYLFGIVDCKLKQDGTVVILELGNGCFSSFSGHGAFIMEHFLNEFWHQTDDKQIFLPFHLLVSDKYLTHCCLSQYSPTKDWRPKCLPFKRDVLFSMEYVEHIVATVEEYFGNCDNLVLKLNNYSMGRGIFMVSKSELKPLLCRLLNLETLDNENEHELYWKICDCTIFLIEEHVTNSKLVTSNGIDYYNATMRVGFAIDATNRCQYLHFGSYWKLPPLPFENENLGRDTCISSVDIGGTLPTSDEEDHLVKAKFEQILPKFFEQYVGYSLIQEVFQKDIQYEDNSSFERWLVNLRMDLASTFLYQIERLCLEECKTFYSPVAIQEELEEYLHYFYYTLALHLLESGDAALCSFTTLLIQEKLLHRQSRMAKAEMHRAYAMQLLQTAFTRHAKEAYHSQMLQNTCNSILLQFQQALLMNPYFVDCSMSLSQYFFSLAKFCFSKDSTSADKKQLLEYAYESLEDALFAFYRQDLVLLLLNIQVHRGEPVEELLAQCNLDSSLLDEDSQEIMCRRH